MDGGVWLHNLIMAPKIDILARYEVALRNALVGEIVFRRTALCPGIKTTAFTGICIATLSKKTGHPFASPRLGVTKSMQRKVAKAQRMAPSLHRLLGIPYPTLRQKSSLFLGCNGKHVRTNTNSEIAFGSLRSCTS